MTKDFQSVFGYPPVDQVWSPFRVNLIGEHIDYCGGSVLPMAINRGTTLTYGFGSGETLRVYSQRFDELLEIVPASVPSGTLGAEPLHWRSYLAGALAKSGVDIPRVIAGLNIFISQDAGGAGLSSSASFCMGLLRVLGKVGQPQILMSDDQRVLLSQQARQIEHEYARVSCGIMDQMSIALGGVIKLDCNELTWKRHAAGLQDMVIVVMDTAKDRTLAGSKYNERVAELSEIARLAGLQDIARLATEPVTGHLLSPRLARRFRHIQMEHQRVERAFMCLSQSDWPALGELMNESHASLRDDYAVSCEELDMMVDLACAQPGVLGARMTGGGFGGCAIALAQKDSVNDWLPRVKAQYQAKTGLSARLFQVEAGQGLG